MDLAQPAHFTKHLPILSYPFLNATFHLNQLADGAETGTALWLGGQCLALYLAQSHARFKSQNSNLPPRAIELGSGIGLTTLALSSLGWDVLASDVHHIISAVLVKNIKSNISALPRGSGNIQIRELDWNVSPEQWNWDSPVSVTAEAPDPPALPPAEPTLQPPFDLIISADTVYKQELVTPLLRTLHSLSVSTSSLSNRYPFILLCIEKRDPALIRFLFAEARETWGFSVECIPHTRLSKCIDKAGIRWDRGDWEGVEIWKLRLSQ